MLYTTLDNETSKRMKTKHKYEVIYFDPTHPTAKPNQLHIYPCVAASEKEASVIFCEETGLKQCHIARVRPEGDTRLLPLL